jgi:hypothetical protein
MTGPFREIDYMSGDRSTIDATVIVIGIRATETGIGIDTMIEATMTEAPVEDVGDGEASVEAITLDIDFDL